MIRTVQINIGLLAVFVLLLEGIFGHWFSERPALPYHVPRNDYYEMEVRDLYPGRDKVTYSRDQWGLRGSFGTPGNVHVLTIGGSTTDQFYIDDSETWQEQMMRQFAESGLSLPVANAGLDGQSSIGHILAMQAWLSQIPGLRPKIVLFLVGLNDIAVEAREKSDAILADTPVKSFAAQIADRSAIWRLYRAIRGALAAHRYKLAHGSWTVPPDVKWSRIDKTISVERRRLLDAYAKRLHHLAQLTFDWGAQPAFVTQPRMDSRPDGDDGFLVVDGNESARLTVLYNLRTIATCRSIAGAMCLDLAADLRFTPEDFYDSAHYTPTGARKIGVHLAEEIMLRSGSQETRMTPH